MKLFRIGIVIALFVFVLLSTVLTSTRLPLSMVTESEYEQADAIPLDLALSQPQTQNKVGVKFLSDPPSWAQDAETIMAELENWRGQTFLRPLEIQIKPRMANEPAGWYSPETRQLIVTSDGSDTFRRGVMLHEIFHALQDQTFDLLALHQSANSADADQALDALIEGEAMLAVSELLNYDFTTHAKLPETGPISDDLFNRLFEYGDGMAFVRSLRASGGWMAVNQAFESPPLRTSDIYHPEQYLAAPSQSSESSRSVGEYGFRLWLARSPEARSHLNELGQGYQSDQRFVSETGQNVWQIEFKDASWVAMTMKLAPEAIAMMPNGPTSYELSGEDRTMILSWDSQK